MAWAGPESRRQQSVLVWAGPADLQDRACEPSWAHTQAARPVRVEGSACLLSEPGACVQCGQCRPRVTTTWARTSLPSVQPLGLMSQHPCTTNHRQERTPQEHQVPQALQTLLEPCPAPREPGDCGQVIPGGQPRAGGRGCSPYVGHRVCLPDSTQTAAQAPCLQAQGPASTQGSWCQD